jgi:hypothetical protein
MRAELPSKSPMVGLNWARAIFMGVSGRRFPQRLKPLEDALRFGTAEAVP